MLMFGMKAYLINTHLLVPRSVSSAKVKVEYQGYISQKMAFSETHLVLFVPIIWYQDWNYRLNMFKKTGLKHTKICL